MPAISLQLIMVLRTTLAAALLVLAAAAPAHAAAPWSAPLTIGPPANGAAVSDVAFSPRGQGLMGWRLGESHYLATVGAGGVLGAPQRLPAVLAAGPAIASGPPLPTPPGSDRAIVFLTKLLAPAPKQPGEYVGQDRTRLSWALVAPDATLGAVHRLSIERCLTCQVKLAVNWRGESVAAWRTDHGTVRASWRPAGGRFSAPVTILAAARGQYPSLAVAIGSDGRSIVADAGAVVRARVRPRGGRLGPIMRAGRGDGSTRVAAAISNGGRAIVAWGSQDGGEEANEPWIVRAARLGRGGGRFSVPQTLDAGSAVGRPEGRIALAFTPAGKATVAWSAVAAGYTFPVMAAAASKTGGRFGPPQQLAPSGAVGAVTVRADGAGVVVWSLLIGSQQATGVFASTRPPGAAAFVAPEAIGEPESVFFPPTAALDPVSGRTVAAWQARPLVEPVPQVVDTAVLHVASRAAP